MPRICLPFAWFLSISALILASGSGAARDASEVARCDGQPAKLWQDWQTGNWSSCQQNVALSSQLRCAIRLSIRTRSVRCIHHTEVNSSYHQQRVLSDATCNSLTRPGNWSLCNVPCYRAGPADYHWTHGDWTKCSYLCRAANSSTKMRTQRRDVTCEHGASGATVSDALCTALSPSPAPRDVRKCRFQDADCVDGRVPACAYDDWSAWTPCQMTCGAQWCRTRSRIPVTFPKDSTDVCLETMQVERCQQEAGRSPSSGYVLRAGDWGRCIVDTTVVPLGPPRDITIYQEPRIGLQWRHMSCVRIPDGSAVPHHLCRHGGGRRDQSAVIADQRVRRLCVVPQDCEVTAWSNWTSVLDAQHLCTLTRDGRGGRGDGGVQFVWPASAVMRRSRRIKVQRFGAGRECPHLTESAPVGGTLVARLGLRECSQLYEWYAGDWLSCVVTQDTSSQHRYCGHGQQRRAVFCRRFGDASQRPVDEALCVYTTDAGMALVRPPSTQRCYERCVASCRVSEWEAWSPCRQPECRGQRNSAGGRQSRGRAVLTEPGEHGRPCPHLAESRDCGYKSCWHYVVDERRAGPCGLQAGDAPGGRWGCVYPARWGERHKKCRCSRRCPTWRQLRKKGAWRSFSECEPIGERNATRWQRVKYLSRPEDNLEHCPTEFEARECRAPDAEPRVFAWHADSFPTECRSEYRRAPLVLRLPRAPLPACKVCSQGVRYRPIYCVRMGQDGEKMMADARRYMHVQARKCPSARFKPHNGEVCHICCPNACRYSSWGAWGRCLPEACTSARGGSLRRRAAKCSHKAPCAVSAAGEWSRSRHQLSAVVARGRVDSCREHTQTERCTLAAQLCHAWHTGNWSGCSYVAGLRCLGSFRTRHAFCRRSDGRPVTADHCAHLPRPPTAELCQHDCNALCLFSPWASWSACSESRCGTGHRTRTRHLQHNLKEALSVLARPCGALRETELCARAPCRDYRLKYMPWSTWQPYYGLAGECRFAVQTRLARCLVKGSRRSLPLAYCASRKAVSRTQAACPRRCELTQWQRWTASCDQPCGHGWRHRAREQPAFGVAPCPAEQRQRRPCLARICTPPGARRTWHADPWAPCHPQGSADNVATALCTSISTQRRNVFCLEHLPGGEKPIVADELCAGQTPPTANRTCIVACLADCVWSAWSGWSRCQQAQRTRLRSIVRAERPGGRCSYSNVQETEHCDDPAPTLAYRLSVGPWTKCQRLDDDDDKDECRPAEQRRLAVCFERTRRRLVDLELCGAKARRQVLSRPCTLPCFRQCKLSAWCGWTRCEGRCDTAGTQRRRRRVLREASGGATPCPGGARLREERACAGTRPCYAGRVHPWSQCVIDGADCGEGVRARKLTCRRGDGELASPLKCFSGAALSPGQELNVEQRLVHETEPCRVPCPGECRYTPWSSWSLACVANCNSYVNSSRVYKGRRVAFRSVTGAPDADARACTARLWVSKQCKEAFCMEFDWTAGVWSGTARPVRCRRSDGVAVSDAACAHKRRPHAERCHPPCAAAEGATCRGSVCARVVRRGTLVCGAGGRCVSNGGGGGTVLVVVEQRTSGRERRRVDDARSDAQDPNDQRVSTWPISILLASLLCVLALTTAVLTIAFNIYRRIFLSYL